MRLHLQELIRKRDNKAKLPLLLDIRSMRGKSSHGTYWWLPVSTL